jgi:hypothetical protein
MKEYIENGSKRSNQTGNLYTVSKYWEAIKRLTVSAQKTK